MFDFADVTRNGILVWNIQFAFCVFCPLAIIIQKKPRNDCLSTKKGHTDGIISSFKREILMFYFDVIRRRFVSVLIRANQSLVVSET